MAAAENAPKLLSHRTAPEMKKKWSDIKADTNKCVGACWQSEGATGGVQGTVKLTPLDECLASIIGNCLVSGVAVVPQREGDTDLTMDKAAVGESLLFSCAASFLNCRLHNATW